MVSLKPILLLSSINVRRPFFWDNTMAELKYKNKTYYKVDEICSVMAQEGVLYERWPTHDTSSSSDGEILRIYQQEIEKISQLKGYRSADLVCLTLKTPKLDEIIEKFRREHHHLEDEVRFTVEGEGFFVIKGEDGEFLEFKSEASDLIVIPAKKRHYFTLTPKQHIRTIRLFKNNLGWEALYSEKP
jgi:1,2-dihydroxy-3-keto-5-methylthiopentene dioxygenase